MNTENNKIIAEFMGYKKESDDVYPLIYLIHADWFAVDELQFNHDWNWLMKVIEKIESLGFKTSIENGFCSIDTNEIYFETKDFNPTKIQTTFNVCVEFIKWYNEQKN